jgi:hypothetical protein
MTLGFTDSDPEDPRLLGVGQADAQPGEGDSPQTIAQTVTVRIERDRGLVLALLLAMVALALRR